MYYQLRRSNTPQHSPIRISFKKYSRIWRLINVAFIKIINFTISFPVVLLLILIVPITLVFKWIVSMAHRIACLGGRYKVLVYYIIINIIYLIILFYNFQNCIISSLFIYIFLSISIYKKIN